MFKFAAAFDKLQMQLVQNSRDSSKTALVCNNVCHSGLDALKSEYVSGRESFINKIAVVKVATDKSILLYS